MTTHTPSKFSLSYEAIKLGIDAHAEYYWVSSQVDGATPQPVQKMTFSELMLFVVKQLKLTRNVVTYYEAEIGVSVHFLSVTNYRCHLLLMKHRYGAEYS